MSGSHRIGETEFREFVEDYDYWKSGAFDVERDTAEFVKVQAGTMSAMAAIRGKAAIYHFYGQFRPGTTPLEAKMYFLAEGILAQIAEGAGTFFFLEYTPEASSYFLAIDLRSKPFFNKEELTRLGHLCCHQLMVKLQETQRAGMARELDTMGRVQPTSATPDNGPNF